MQSTFEKIKPLIVELRNRRNTVDNWSTFKKQVHLNKKEIISEFSCRWLISICDTYADYGNPVQSRNAFIISMFVNMIRVADTYRFTMTGEHDADKLNLMKSKQIELYDGLMSLHIDRQDTCLNLSKRSLRLLKVTPLLFEIYIEIVNRLKTERTLIADFASLSSRPSFVFPVDANNIPDNHGII